MAREKRYASEAEKQAAYRLRKKGGVMVTSPSTNFEWVEKEAVVETPIGDNDDVPSEGRVVADPIELTPTDRRFEEERPGYYIFRKEIIRRMCAECGNGFGTHLELNKFCGPKCKKKFLDEHFSTAGKSE